jgi:hypothetical protein
MKRLRSFAFGAALVALLGSVASADMYTFDLSGLSTDAGFVDSFPTLTHDFGSAGTVVEVSFDVNYESFDPSWLSEMIISVDTDDDLSLDGDIDMFFYGAPDNPGTFSASDTISAASFSSNGLVYLTIWEFFADSGVSPDATFGAGSTVTVTFTPVPEPSGLALLGIGVVGTLAVARRRGARKA